MEHITMTAVANNILVKQCSASMGDRSGGIPALSRGTSHISADDISKPNTCLSYLLFKLRTRVSWAGIMLALGTLYMLINVLNFLDLYKENLHYALVVGPPPKLHLILLFVATIIGSVLYFFETFNTISILFRKKGTLLTITVEMVVMISLIHIPISALNYLIAQCRGKYTSMMQILSGVFSILFVFMRIVWFAHMQGKKLKGNDKKEIRQGVFMAVCALFSCAIAFQILTWRSAPFKVALEHHHTNNVSILLVRLPEKTNRRLAKSNLYSHYIAQGLNPKMPYLVENLTKVIGAEADGVEVYYDCTLLKHNQRMPSECSGGNATGLIFKFVYIPKAGNPYGEVHYNYAVVDIFNSSRLNLHQQITLNVTREAVVVPRPVETQGNSTLYNSMQYNDNNNNTEYSTNQTYFVNMKNQTKTIFETRTHIETLFTPKTVKIGDLRLSKCRDATSPLGDSWLLWYVVILKQDLKKGVNTVTSPWNGCTTPHPRYISDLPVCPWNDFNANLPSE